MNPSGVKGTKLNNYFSILYFVLCCSLYSRNSEQLNFLAKLNDFITELGHVNSTHLLCVKKGENFVNHCTSKFIHGVSKDWQKFKPIEFALVSKGFLECLELKFFEKYSIFLQCLIEMFQADDSGLISIVFD